MLATLASEKRKVKSEESHAECLSERVKSEK